MDWIRPQWDLETHRIAYLWLWPPRDARLPGRLQVAVEAEEVGSVVLLVGLAWTLLELIFKLLHASFQPFLGDLRDARTVLTTDVAELHIGPCDLR